MRHAKAWLVQLATRTKREVVDFLYDYDFSLGGQNIRTNMNILPLGYYDVTIRMDLLETHKVVLDCYAKTPKYKDENDTTRTVQCIQKLVSVRQFLVMLFKKCMRKGCQVFSI
jgi:hypothetical protein